MRQKAGLFSVVKLMFKLHYLHHSGE